MNELTKTEQALFILIFASGIVKTFDVQFGHAADCIIQTRTNHLLDSPLARVYLSCDETGLVDISEAATSSKADIEIVLEEVWEGDGDFTRY